ncbi:MAG: chromosome segregation protein SMC, partial [Clostridia bacterium]|nr:chromosome segregation protein SMC [Clostridia bacterium]
MYLKKLEIHGFKSFADKTTLEFKPGVTIVVGPNGSGKSNIADAVRWVLGEQSVKSLRGGKMEDVIFAGSEKRRSLGMAEVSLTIDNTSGAFPLEFNEVMVTRRLYRSGESDYLINRVPCRLKDIHELFMDTGVGREGISIIGQGKVDEILSVKPEERRGLIEEAAGIVKYRYRKKEAVRKLEDTQASLIRLGDIVQELESQQEPLAEQARVAKIYKEQKSELDALEIGLLLEEINSARRRLQNIEKNRLNQEQEIEESRAKLLSAQAREEEQKLLLHKKEEEINLQQERVYKETVKLEKTESEMKLITERLADLSKQKKTFHHDLQQLKEELESLGREYQDHQKTGESLQQNLLEARQKLQDYENFLAEDNLADQQLAHQLDHLKNEHFDALQDEARLHNELNALRQRLVLLERQKEQSVTRRAAVEADVQKVQETLSSLEKETAALSDLQDSLRRNLLSAETKLQEETKKQTEFILQQRKLEDESNSLSARQRVLEEMEREGQGYAHGVREVLKQSSGNKLAGIIGSVAQVLSVPKKYEIAAEVALGGALQHIITENEDTARKAIEWLKANDKGRVTFLPLSTISAGNEKQTAPSGQGVLGRLSELVGYDAKYRQVIEYLAGRVWVVENLSTAIVKARETGYRCRLVTLDGQLINAGGSMTGGSFKQNPGGILSRKRTLQELEVENTRLEALITLTAQNITNGNHVLTALKADGDSLREQLRALEIKQAENMKTRERWGAEHERHLSELETILWQIREQESEEGALRQEAVLQEKTALELKSGLSQAQEEMEKLSASLKAKQLERIKKNEKLTDMRIRTATFEEKLTSFQKESTYLGQRLKQLRQYKEDKERDLNDLKIKTKEFEKNYAQLEKLKDTELKNILAFEKIKEEMKGSRHALQESINLLQQELKDIASAVKDKEDKLHQFDIQQSKYEVTLEATALRLQEQYALDYETALERCPETTDRKAAQQRILELKEEILSLGEVNLAAIEEHKKLVERLEFLTVQIADMTEASERLQDVIREMNQIMTRKFNETYHLVDKAFQEMFVKMFGGGRAQLVLTQAEDVLEAGVEIIAQPPGKKTQYLSLLSGGEKAL